MNKYFLFFFLTLASWTAQASTFVGNGGSILDSELRSTIGRLKKAVLAIEKDSLICECAGNSSQCAVLEDLNEAQTDYCKEFVEGTKDSLMSVLNDQTLTFRWAEKVQSRDRNFDAAASASTKTVLLDSKRFASLATADRIQLLAHEMLHLVRYQGQPLVDKGSRGPFKGEEGGRQLLDTAGAALTIIAMRAEVIPVEASQISQPFKNVYLSYAGGTRKLDTAYRKSALQGETIRNSSVELNWYPKHTDNFGYSLGFYNEYETYDKFKRPSLISDLRMQAVTAGVSYRLLPFEAGIAWFDGIQFATSLRLGRGQVHYEIKDDFNKLSGQSSLTLAEAKLVAQLPLLWNFWLTLSQGFIHTPHEVSKLNIKSKSINLNNSVGVSYGISL